MKEKFMAMINEMTEEEIKGIIRAINNQLFEYGIDELDDKHAEAFDKEFK